MTLNNVLAQSIEIKETFLGSHYVVTQTKGPFVRVTASQRDHVEFGLRNWLEKTLPEEIERVQKDTADKGTILHGYISSILTHKSYVCTDPWALPVLEKFKAFVDKHALKPIFTEHCLVSEQLGMGGTVDFLGDANLLDVPGFPTTCVLDWKSGNVYPSHAVQLSLYMVMIWELTGTLHKNLAIVQVPRDGGDIEIYPVSEPLKALKAGLHTFERWKYDNRHNLKWACAPREVTEARAKTRGKKREEFENSEWIQVYEWPWLYLDSLKWYDQFIQHLGKEKT